MPERFLFTVSVIRVFPYAPTLMHRCTVNGYLSGHLSPLTVFKAPILRNNMRYRDRS
jgi:hypothetical protein